jgi:hypothetical protein
MSPFKIEVSVAISVDLLRVNPERIYVFEDTLDRSGSYGSAALRRESNACGIPTRKSPGLASHTVFSDQDHEFEAVTLALRQLYKAGRRSTLVFPSTGIGHGPYGLVNHSPKIYSHVCQILQDHFGYQQPALTDVVSSLESSSTPTPFHHQLLTKICTGGGIIMASLIAEQHQMSLEELKALCSKAGAELEMQGRLYPLYRPVYRWASDA